MGVSSNEKLQLRLRRKLRIRKKVSGTAERPRLSIFRSAKHMTAQVIDDMSGKTLLTVHSFDLKGRANKEACAQLGKDIAAKCKAKNISSIVFDKNGYRYHGRVQALADGVREGGIQF